MFGRAKLWTVDVWQSREAEVETKNLQRQQGLGLDILPLFTCNCAVHSSFCYYFHTIKIGGVQNTHVLTGWGVSACLPGIKLPFDSVWQGVTKQRSSEEAASSLRCWKQQAWGSWMVLGDGNSIIEFLCIWGQEGECPKHWNQEVWDLVLVFVWNLQGIFLQEKNWVDGFLVLLYALFLLRSQRWVVLSDLILAYFSC